MNQRDLELLSAYLDGQLKPSDSTRLEARLQTDPQLASVLTDLRATRSLLRKLPQRRAPRNFTLTRKMVGQNPPLPRTYPIFRFATALATLLFVFSFGVNTVGRQMASQALLGIGGGGGCDPATDCAEVQSFAAEAPAAAPAVTEAPLLSQAPLAPAPTETAPAADAARIVDTPAAKTAEDASNAVGHPDQLQVQSEAQSPAPLVPSIWQIGLAVAAVISAVLMLLMQRIAMSRWRKE